MKTAISLPDPLFEAADELAKRLGISRSELFQRAMERLLSDYREELITATLDRVYGDQPEGVDPALAQMQSMTLPRDDW